MHLSLQPVIDNIEKTVASHALGSPGKYCRWLWQNNANNRNLEASEYGCADAANILYSIGKFERDPQRRADCVEVLRDFQNPESGLFCEPTHHPIHTTAHCIAALELFDAGPRYPLHELEPYLNPQKLVDFLASLDWVNNPWPQSHRGAGLFAAFVNTGMATPEWKAVYFNWLKEHADPEYGMSLVGSIQSGKSPEAFHLFGWFHYLFNHEYAHQPFPYPERLLDRCLAMYREKTLGTAFFREIGFREIDWVFAVNRASRQTAHRFEETRMQLRDFAKHYIAYLSKADAEHDDGFNDLHMLFGTVCALAELQIALPGEIETDLPLKNVLDRRPFI